MKKKIVGIVLIIISLLVIAGIIYLLFFAKDISPNIALPTFNKEKSQPVAEEGQNQKQIPVSQPVKEEIKRIVHEENAAQDEPDIFNESDIKRMAAAFAERFGSYSNQSNYNNIKDLRIFMSQKMQSWSDSYVSQIQEQAGTNTIYYGITTKALFQEVIQFDDDAGKAEILVKTQRRESTGTMANSSSFYQDIRLLFIKENNIWKVDSATWLE
jgi:hypothetical protein